MGFFSFSIWRGNIDGDARSSSEQIEKIAESPIRRRFVPALIERLTPANRNCIFDPFDRRLPEWLIAIDDSGRRGAAIIQSPVADRPQATTSCMEQSKKALESAIRRRFVRSLIQ
jgi:hypothetical protein